MGTKKSLLYSILAFSALMDPDFIITDERNHQPTRESSPDSSGLSKALVFHKEEGIAKMIRDYKEIQLGDSKKTPIKQARITAKIKGYLASGMLTESLVSG